MKKPNHAYAAFLGAAVCTLVGASAGASPSPARQSAGARMEMAVARMMGDGVLSDGLWIGYSLFDGDHEGASLVTVTAALGNVARYQGGCMRAVRDAFDVTQTGDDGRRASKPAGLSISSACAWWGSETETLPQLNADGER